jgi:hypothetical protein
MKKSSSTAAECANCADFGGPHGIILKLCSKCKLVSYCSQACQLQHWRQGKHKQFCIANDARMPPKTSEAAPTNHNLNETDICVICRDILSAETYVALQCGHRFHKECIFNFIVYASSELCPLCRASIHAVQGMNDLHS